MRIRRPILSVERLEDRCTPADFGNPWPDAAHLSLSFAPDSTPISNQASTLFQTLDALAPTKTWQQEILRAFQTWAVQGNINVRIVSDSGLPFGTTGAIQGDPRFGDIRIGSYDMPLTGEAAAVPFQVDAGTWAGAVTLNSAAPFGLNGSGQYDLFSVLLHEAGHVFGLAHNTDPTSVMYPNFTGIRTGLSTADAAALQALYGARSADAYEGSNGNGQLSSATSLEPSTNSDGTVSRSANADITTLQDRDVYTFSTLVTTGAVTVTLRTAGVSLLVPRVTVYDATGQAVASAVAADPLQGGLVLRLDHVKPMSRYYVKVESGQQNVFGIGSYQLAVSFQASSSSGSLTSSVSYGLTALTTVINTDAHTNDSFATASALPQVAGDTDAHFDYAFQGSISDASDVDFFKIKAPKTKPAQDSTLTAMIWGAPNQLDPRVRVFNSQKQPVAAEVLVNDSLSYTIQIRDAVPNATYYVEVLAANPRSAHAVGSYFLGVDFSPGTIDLVDYVGGTLTNTQQDNFAGLTLEQNQLFHFVLSASTPGSGVIANVQMTITNAAGQVVFTLDGNNYEPVSRNVLLTPGTYSVRFSGSAGTGIPLPTLNYRLRGEPLTDPIGPEGGDPTGDPGNPFTGVRQDVAVGLSSTLNASYYSQDVTFTATVTPSGTPPASAPTGSVIFYDNGTSLGSATLAGGAASFTVTYLGTGDHNITAIYQGDTYFNAGSSSPLTQTVLANDTAITLSAPASSSYYTQPMTVTANVNPSGTPVTGPTGTVIFYDNGSWLANVDMTDGAASLIVSSLGVGTHTITADYVGDGVFNGSTTSDALTQTVLANNTAVSLTASALSTTYGQNVTFTATVTPSDTPLSGPIGSVAFCDNGTCLAYMPLTNGVATFDISNLGVGTHSITANYLGDSTFSGSSSAPLTYTVSHTNSALGLSSSGGSSHFTQAVIFTATMALSGPTGDVVFYSDGTELGSVALADGAASLTIANLTVGTHNVTAVYQGDATYSSSSSDPLSQIVLANNTAVSLTSSVSDTYFTQEIVFTASVTPVDTPLTEPTGGVSFYDNNNSYLGSAALTDGVASFSLSGLAAGTHSVTAVYDGDSTFSAGSSNDVTQTVTANNTTISLDASASSSFKTENVTFTVTVSPSDTPLTGPMGTVIFYDNGSILGTATLADGVATLTGNNLDVGDHAITAVYQGDGVFSGSSSNSASHTVSANDVVVSLTSSVTSTLFNQDVTFSVTVTPSDTPVTGPTGTVAFYDNGTYLGSADLNDGAASFTISNLGVGDHTITAVYQGDAAFSGGSSAPLTQVVAPNTAVNLDTSATSTYYTQDGTFTVTVTSTDGSQAQPTGWVAFYDNGAYLGSAELTDGAASFALNSLGVGDHTITAEYLGDGTFSGSFSVPVSQTVLANNTAISLTSSTSSAAFGQGVTFNVAVTPDGTPVTGVTGTVILYDNGVYLATVDLTDGSASLILDNLAIGDHVITAVYQGDAVFTGSSSGSIVVSIVEN